MLIIPAIDIKDGKCVRLTRGKYESQIIYYNDPLIPAIKWKEAGARLLHIVDLDGAKLGKMRNLNIIKNIKEKTGIEIEVGGGIRNSETIKELINAGISRIVIGTAAIENQDFIGELNRFKEYIVFSIDIEDDKLKTHGWLKESNIKYQEFLNNLRYYGFYRVIITDITRDGTLEGINTELYKKIGTEFPEMEIIVSGGISSIEDIKCIMALNISSIKGIIIGKALYEDKINLKEAIEYVSQTDNTLS